MKNNNNFDKVILQLINMVEQKVFNDTIEFNTHKKHLFYL